MINELENKIGAIIRDTKLPNHCRQLPLDFTPRPNRKTIIILPGNQTNTPEAANGMCKIVENMLQKYAPLCDIICFYYTDLDTKASPEQIRKDAQNIGNMIFKNNLSPLISSNNKNEKARISANTAAENMRNVMLFNHCFGSYITEAIENNFKSNFNKLNYLKTEQKYIAKQLFVVHNNNISENMGEYEPLFSHLERFTKADRKRQKTTYQNHSFQRYIQDEPLTQDEVLLVPVRQNISALLTAQLTKEGGDEHDGAQWDENKTEAGLIEEDIASGLMAEFVLSKKPLDNIAKEIQNAHNHGLINLSNEKLQEITEYGQEYADDYQEYRQKKILKSAQLKTQTQDNQR